MFVCAFARLPLCYGQDDGSDLVVGREIWFSFLCSRSDYLVGNHSSPVSATNVIKLVRLPRLRGSIGTKICLVISSDIQQYILAKLN